MTDPIATLLHDEASALDIPAPPTDAVLTRGRAVRRRRRTTRAVAGAIAAIVVIAGGAAVVSSGHDRQVEPARLPDRTAYEQHGAWAVGDEVHVGNHVVVVPGAQQLQYTSAGVVVTTATGARVLVTPDGGTRSLHLRIVTDHDLGTIGTDATEPYVAYVRDGGQKDQLVVLDLSTGKEHEVGGPFRESDTRPSGAESLSGDEAYYSHVGNGRLVNWRTDERLKTPPGPWNTPKGLGHGATIGYDSERQTWVVTSRTDGSTLLSVPVENPSYAEVSLSVDGHYLAVSKEDGGFEVYTVATGDSVSFSGDRDVSDYGWTPDGHLVGKRYRLNRSEVEVCDPVSGSCTGTGTEIAPALTLTLGSTAYSH